MDEPKVTIVILNYNGWQDSIECLKSLFGIDYKKNNILLIDNHSDDDSVNKIKLWADSAEIPFGNFKRGQHVNLTERLTILENDENAGFSEGCNIGIRCALQDNADYVLLLNNDTVVEPDFLNILVNTLECNPDFFIAGSIVKNYYSRDVVFTNSKIDVKLKAAEKTDYLGSKLPYFPTDRAHGCCMLLRSEHIKKYSLSLCSGLFLFGEEMEVSLRAKSFGLKTVVANNAFIYHKEGASDNDKPGSYRIYYCTRNRILIAKMHLRRFKRILFYVSFIISNTIKIALWTMTGNMVSAKFTIRAICDGLLNRTGKKNLCCE